MTNGADIRSHLKDKKRIVVKVGTSTLTYENGKLNLNRIDRLARVLSDIQNMGKELILVSSGAMGVGVGRLKLGERPNSVSERQAVAAVGQSELMHIYSRAFSEYGHIVGQILLTRDVIDNEYSRGNVINTFMTLMKMEIIPIVNENDSVSIEEIANRFSTGFGDNDTLSVIVAKLVEADLLIILTDINGFYDKDPRKHKDAALLSHISSITPSVEKAAGGVGSLRGTGGMLTKISAAKMAIENGIDMVLASGEDPLLIYDIIGGKDIGTLFSGAD
jgi:glutamate 5-kinase